MRYVGGKSKIAGGIAEAILATTTSRGTYLEPFVGGGSVLAKIAPHFQQALAGDAHEDLILMWEKVRGGWLPPAVDYDEYQRLRYDPAPSAERGFAGFGGSFGGRWFEGFARGGFSASGAPRNHQAESVRAVERIQTALAPHNVFFGHKDYRAWPTDCGGPMVIYCDPPYLGSSKDYKPGKFDTAAFWDTANRWVDEGHEVFVSEYVAPEGWVSIWDVQKRQSLVHGLGNRDIRTENLFTRGEPS